MNKKKSTASDQKSRIWDLPTRICHWALTFCFVGAVVSVNYGFMQVHLGFGISLFALVLFRLLWGFCGSESARFKTFLPRVKDIRLCLISIRQKNKPHIGHDALGGLATCVLLAILLITPLLGMFANDDLLFRGPLADLVSQQVSDQFSALHRNIVKVAFIIICFHIVAVLFYWLYKKDNIIIPMVTGTKLLPSKLTKQASAMYFGNSKNALLCLIVALVVVGIILV